MEKIKNIFKLNPALAKKVGLFLLLSVGAIIVCVSLISSYAATWKEPTTVPPGNNVAAPLNTGTTTQTVTGSKILTMSDGTAILSVAGGINISRASVLQSNILVGATTSLNTNYMLEVRNGPIKATGGFIIETRTTNPLAPEVGRMWVCSDGGGDCK